MWYHERKCMTQRGTAHAASLFLLPSEPPHLRPPSRQEYRVALHGLHADGSPVDGHDNLLRLAHLVKFHRSCWLVLTRPH